MCGGCLAVVGGLLKSATPERTEARVGSLRLSRRDGSVLETGETCRDDNEAPI